MSKSNELEGIQGKALKHSDKVIQTDPQGSYTGRPKDPYEVPVQDADDL